MAFESRFWRSKIKKDIKYISKIIEINILNLEDEELDKIFSELEIRFFTIMYSLRKMMDLKKMPDSTAKTEIRVESFLRNKDKHMKWYLCDDYYDLQSAKKHFLVLREVCNQFIHAYFFQPLVNSRKKIGVIHFVSDRQKNNTLYSVNIKYLLRKISSIIDKYPRMTSITYNKETRRYDIVSE